MSAAGRLSVTVMTRFIQNNCWVMRIGEARIVLTVSMPSLSPIDFSSILYSLTFSSSSKMTESCP